MNYRPVSLANVVCKLLEKIIGILLEDILAGGNYWSEKQQILRSCTMNLIAHHGRVGNIFENKT